MIMGLVLVEESSLDDVGLALQEKLNTDKKFLPSEMGGGIREIETEPDGFLKGSFYDIDGNLFAMEYIQPVGDTVDIAKISNSGVYSTTPTGNPVTFPYTVSENTDFYEISYHSIMSKNSPNFITNTDGSTLQTYNHSYGRGIGVSTTNAYDSFGAGNKQTVYVNTNPNTFWKLSAGCNDAYNAGTMWGPIDVSNYNTINIINFECNDGVGWGSCGFGFCTDTTWHSSGYRGANSISPYAYYRNRNLTYYKNIYGDDFIISDVLTNHSHPAWETITVDVSNLNSVYFWIYTGDAEFAIKDIYLT